MVVVIGFLFGACCSVFAVGSVMYLFMITKTSKEILNSLNERGTRKEIRLKALKRLINFVDIHITTKR